MKQVCENDAVWFKSNPSPVPLTVSIVHQVAMPAESDEQRAEVCSTEQLKPAVIHYTCSFQAGTQTPPPPHPPTLAWI